MPSLPRQASLRYVPVLDSASLETTDSFAVTHSKSQIDSIVQQELFSCCDIVNKSLFWMGWCCTPVTNAQLLTRMGLNWYGEPATPDQVASTFGIVVGIFIAFLVFNFWIPFVGLFFLIYTVVYGTKLRKAMRTKYNIPATTCGEKACWDDCCCMFWCSCCNTIQMARHTHDEDEHPYQCCTSTGLTPDAPSIV
jgi:Cys-rich protein (TIGR01571 family)